LLYRLILSISPYQNNHYDPYQVVVLSQRPLPNSSMDGYFLSGVGADLINIDFLWSRGGALVDWQSLKTGIGNCWPVECVEG